MRASTTLAALLVLAATPLAAQRPAAWHAHWIADTSARGDEAGAWIFRRVVELPEKPARFVVRVSADNRYRLQVNGAPVAEGPQRSDLMHWRYETVDLAPWLHAGRNVIAAAVWNWGALRPVGQQSRRTAFLLEGEGVSTGDPGWRVQRDRGWGVLPVTGEASGGYYAASPGESFDMGAHPWGWSGVDFDDASWAPAGVLERAQSAGSDEYGLVGTWQLAPRTLPMLVDSVVRLVAVRRAEGVAVDARFVRGEAPFTVPAHTRATVVLDEGVLVNAHAIVETSGGAGSTLALTYAEAPRGADGAKAHRDSLAGKTIVGVRDVLRADGARHTFRSRWFRTWRYVQLDVETADAPLVVHDVRGEATGYPYPMRARFASDAAWIDSVWAMDARTARACAWETFFDTPYYEQLQYVGDTRLQALLMLYQSGDDRLVREALLAFDASRAPDGLTQSRWPSALPQYIPPFSLLWVAMVHDWWMLRDEPALVRRLLPGVRGVLAWYAARVDSSGTIGATPWWGFVDWTAAWPRGVAPGAETGGSTAVAMQYAYALDRAAELEAALGEPARARDDRARAESLRRAVRARAWDARRGLFREAPGVASYSQQANVLAVLAGAVPAAGRAAVMRRVLADPTLVPASYYFRWYLLEALREAGLGDRYVEQLAPWRGMLALGLTTTPEAPEPSRSDSHAWSAHPNHGLLAIVLGVRPASAGFRTVLVEPHLGALQRADGRVPHPRGDVDVSLERRGAAGIRATVTLPAGVTGTFRWGGRAVALHAGRQALTL